MRYVLPPWCFHHAASLKPAPVDFAPLRHIQIRKSSFVAEACLASAAPPSGFDHPLGGFFLPDPLDLISDPSALGVLPFRVFLPSVEPCPFRDLPALLLLAHAWSVSSNPELHLQSFALDPGAALTISAINRSGSRSSLGVFISEVFSLAPLSPLRADSSFALHNHQRTSRRCTLCPRVFLVRGRMDLLEIPYLLDVSHLPLQPSCSLKSDERWFIFFTAAAGVHC